MPLRRRAIRSVVQVAALTGFSVLAALSANASLRESDGGASAPASFVVDGARTGNSARQIALSRGPAWCAFQSRHGTWRAVWNEGTQTPHRAFGTPIALRGFANDPDAVDRAVRAFIAENPDLFGGRPVLETARSRRIGNTWYVSYRQKIDGMTVLFSDWEFRVGSNGRLFAFGADARTPDPSDDRTPRLVAPVAREAALSGLRFDPATDETRSVGEVSLLPVRRADGSTALRPVHRVDVVTHSPRESWNSFVDARTGEVLWRRSAREHAVTGQVTQWVHMKYPTDAWTVRPARHAYVKAGAVTATTDTAGNYSLSAAAYPATITSALEGPYCKIQRQDAADAGFSRSNTSNGTVVNIEWNETNANRAERDAFYHVNWTRDYLRTIDPSFTAMDFQMVTNVNILDNECEAYWDNVTNTLNFFPGELFCDNTGTMPDIIWHEYLHAATYFLYFTEGAALGITNRPLAEGLADAAACMMDDDPIFADGWTGAGTFLRNLDSNARWPEDRSSDDYVTGLIIASAMWDLRQSIGKAAAESLLHYAKYGLADDSDPGVAMNEFFMEVLVADDDDANLSNGTPRFDQIVQAFNQHGIGTDYFVVAVHAPLDDQVSNGPYPIVATAQYNGPFGNLGTATLYYSVNGTDWAASPMLPTGNPDEFGTEIPPQSYGVVKYYMQVTDTYGGTQTLPPGAPLRNPYQFLAGPANTLIYQDMEGSPGWATSAAGDNATFGLWVLDDPYGTIAQPEDDHTFFGTKCYVTGNTIEVDPPGLEDVDAGRATLVTSAFSGLTAGTTHPVISFWYWFSNNAGDAPDEDSLRIDISNDGGTSWVPVLHTTKSNNAWERLLLLVEKYVTPTANMKMRFSVEDAFNPSIVECAIDDWTLYGYGVLDAGDPRPVAALELTAASPNPFEQATRLRYALPAAGRVEIEVFDLLGRRTRTLFSGPQAAGSHDVEWDGRDGGGRPVASGPYFVRLTQDGRALSRAVVKVD